ncbi:hypothetical protein D3C85_1940210 [compost metagenome]
MSMDSTSNQPGGRSAVGWGRFAGGLFSLRSLMGEIVSGPRLGEAIAGKLTAHCAPMRAIQ